MQILILGAGAIGSVFGGLLKKAGHDVFLVGRKLHIQQINENGLFIDGIWGEHSIKNITGHTNLKDLSEMNIRPFDVVLISVKSYDTEKALKQLRTFFSNLPPIVSLQNGFGNIEKIEAHVGKERTIGGRVLFGVEFIEAGHVRVTVEASHTVIGGLKGGIQRGFVEDLANIFTGAGITTDTTDDIYRFIWGKILYNCALNGIATIIDVNYGSLLSCKGTKQIMKNIIEEIYTVARNKNITLDWNLPDEYIKILFNELIPKTSEHHPSMLQDIRQGKKTEIDALNGAVFKMGYEMGIDLPHNHTITQLIKAKEL
jgi:2-dehydropantoate 2-reductase